MDAEPFTATVRTFGNSKGILVPASIVKLLTIKDGSKVLVILKGVKI